MESICVLGARWARATREQHGLAMEAYRGRGVTHYTHVYADAPLEAGAACIDALSLPPASLHALARSRALILIGTRAGEEASKQVSEQGG